MEASPHRFSHIWCQRFFWIASHVLVDIISISDGDMPLASSAAWSNSKQCEAFLFLSKALALFWQVRIQRVESNEANESLEQFQDFTSAPVDKDLDKLPPAHAYQPSPYSTFPGPLACLYCIMNSSPTLQHFFKAVALAISYVAPTPPNPAGTQRSDFGNVKKSGATRLTKIRKIPNSHVFEKVAEGKRCMFLCFCNFYVWDWIAKICKFIAIYHGFVHALRQNIVNTNFCLFWRYKTM